MPSLEIWILIFYYFFLLAGKKDPPFIKGRPLLDSLEKEQFVQILKTAADVFYILDLRTTRTKNLPKVKVVCEL